MTKRQDEFTVWFAVLDFFFFETAGAFVGVVMMVNVTGDEELLSLWVAYSAVDWRPCRRQICASTCFFFLPTLATPHVFVSVAIGSDMEKCNKKPEAINRVPLSD